MPDQRAGEVESGEFHYCSVCKDTGKVSVPVPSNWAMGAGIQPCEACEGVVTVPVASLRKLLAKGIQRSMSNGYTEAVRVVSALLPKRQCPYYIFGQLRHPNGGTQPPSTRLFCGGVEGHSGPHQAPDDAWLVDRD